MRVFDGYVVVILLINDVCYARDFHAVTFLLATFRRFLSFPISFRSGVLLTVRTGYVAPARSAVRFRRVRFAWRTAVKHRVPLRRSRC